MNVCFKIKFSLYVIVTFVASLLVAQSTFAQTITNQQMVVEGSITDNTGAPIDLSGVPLVFFVSTDKGCYLYGETVTTAGDHEGNINHRIGSGVPVPGSPNSYIKNIFFGVSSGTTTFAGNNCTALASDVRLVKVFYQAMDITAVLNLGSVPYAMYAQNATTLNGKSSADFIQVTTDSNTLFNNGSAGQYLTRNASGFLMWITPPAVGVVATSAVTSVNAGEGLIGGVITSSGTLSVNFGTTAGTVAAGNDARINGALQAVNNLGEIKSTALARANLELGSLSTKSTIDLTSDVVGYLPVANGGSPWQLSLAGPMTASTTTIGTTTSYSNVGLTVFAPTQTTNSLIGYFNNTANDGNGVKINVDNTNAQKFGLKVATTNSAVTNFVVLNNGNVGVGVPSPSARFELPAATMTTAAMKFNSGALLTAAASGSFEYDGNRLYITDDSNTRRAIPMGSNLNTIDGISTITTPGSLIVSSSILSTPGSLGLGTIVPVAKLHVFSGASSEIARFDASTMAAYISFTRNGASKGYIGYTYGGGAIFNNEVSDAMAIRSEGAVQIGTSASATVTILATGRVGIGTTTPTTALTVSGSVKVSSVEFADGTSQTTSAFGSYERSENNCGSATNCVATCSAGKKIIAGGCSNTASGALVSSAPVSDTQWFCNYSGSTSSLVAFAICVKM